MANGTDNQKGRERQPISLRPGPCSQGAIGVVYGQYRIGNHAGASVILENGEYDGFSEIEQEMFLERLSESEELAGYEFVSVMHLRSDYDDDLFVEAFRKGWAILNDRSKEDEDGSTRS